MNHLEQIEADAQVQADKNGHQIIVVEDEIGKDEYAEHPYNFYPTLALVIFISTMKHGGKILKVIEPKTSSADRRADLENGLIALFRKDPNLVKRLD